VFWTGLIRQHETRSHRCIQRDRIALQARVGFISYRSRRAPSTCAAQAADALTRRSAMRGRRSLPLRLIAAPAGRTPAAGARERSRAWRATGSSGRSASGGMTRSFDPATGARQRSASQTGPNGRTRSATGRGTVQDGTCSGTRDVTGAGGHARSTEIEVTRR
jgi:hypothetical protein